MPPGAIPVALGLAVNGAAAYGFLAVCSHSLGRQGYAPLATLWALTFLAAPGIFLPLEQEVGRLTTARRVAGTGARPVALTSLAAGLGLAGLVVVAALAAGPVLTSRLFDGDGLFLAAFAASVPAYSLYFLARGLLAGNGRFRSYAAAVVGEGTFRFVVVVALAAAGVRAGGAYALALALPVFLATAAGVAGRRGLLHPGPPVHAPDLSTAFGWLLGASLLAQALANVGPLAVKLLSGADGAAAGTFLNGLIVARIPLFFFQAVQASLLPALAAHAAAGRHDLLRRDLQRLLGTVGGVAGVASVANLAIGPWVTAKVFGSAYQVGHADMGLLAVATGFFMLALSLAAALIALGHHRDTTAGWLLGMVVFALVTLLGGAPAIRVERALVAASGAAFALMAAQSLRRMSGSAGAGGSVAPADG